MHEFYLCTLFVCKNQFFLCNNFVVFGSNINHVNHICHYLLLFVRDGIFNFVYQLFDMCVCICYVSRGQLWYKMTLEHLVFEEFFVVLCPKESQFTVVFFN